MKVDDVVLKSWEMKAIDAFRVKLAEACGLEGHTLRLCSVEMGCLELTFQVPPCVVDSLLPFTAEQKQRLKDLGVLKLTRSGCGGQAVSETLIDSSLPQQTKVIGVCVWYVDMIIDIHTEYSQNVMNDLIPPPPFPLSNDTYVCVMIKI